MPAQSCRTCRWLFVPADANGRRVPRKGRAYACQWPMPESTLPTSIQRYYAVRVNAPTRSYMEPDDGVTCPTWAPLERETGPETPGGSNDR